MISALQKIYVKNDQLKAYTLLSPALILIIVAMAAPMLVMIITSFNTQISMVEIDRTFTFDRYEDFFPSQYFQCFYLGQLKYLF